LASIVDASVFAKWYLADEQLIGQAMALLDMYRMGTEALVCPHYARYELASTVSRAARLGRISRDDALAAMSDFAELAIADRIDRDERVSRAVTLALQYGLSFYDALYLALAEELNARLVTADLDICDRTKESDISVMHLSAL
jgi:predicted nucleic acid-binding protein